MDIESSKNIQRLVKEYFRDNPEFKVTHSTHFDDLVNYIRDQAGKIQQQIGTDADLFRIVALCMLGPDHSPPPEDIQAQFKQVVQNYPESECERILEYAVAFGCGKWRLVNSEKDPWYQVWNGAISMLARAIEPAVKQVNQWLSEHVIGCPQKSFWIQRDKRFQEGLDIIRADAAYLTLRLIQPVTPLHILQDQALYICRTDTDTEIRMDDAPYMQLVKTGAKAVFETDGPVKITMIPEQGDRGQRLLHDGARLTVFSGDADTRIELSDKQPRLTLKQDVVVGLSGPVTLSLLECSCGHIKCVQRHRLEGWEPSPKISLWSFCASAVKGPNVNLQTGSFVQGMYYALLSREGNFKGVRLRLVPVEYKLCQKGDCSNPDKSRKYEGDRCPWCKVPGDPASTPRVIYQRLIAITDSAFYQRVARFRCSGINYSASKNRSVSKLNSLSTSCVNTACSNLCEKPVCPLCNSRLNPHRPIHVWVRVFNRHLSLEDLESKDRTVSEHEGMYQLRREAAVTDCLEDLLIKEEEEEFLYNAEPDTDSGNEEDTYANR